jgi:hypothetical protein
MMPDQQHGDDIDAVFRELVQTDLAARPRPMCECKCNGGEPHSDRLCGRAATPDVALHRWGWCNEDPDAQGFTRPESVDADGNITALMCGPCADHAYQVAKNNIKKLRGQLARDTIPQCPTCGRPTVTPEDIFERRPL